MNKRKHGNKIKIVCLVFIMLLASSLYQYLATKQEIKQQEIIGQMVDVGSYTAHCVVKGTGKMTFVFLQGSGTPSAYTDFSGLQEKLSNVGQTIVFDRAGSGFSSTTSEKRSLDNLIKELDCIINQLSSNSQVILIAHSLASLEAMGYTQAYPEKVKGVVFLDGGSAQYYSEQSELWAKMISYGNGFLRVSGINRLLGLFGVTGVSYGQNVRQQKIDNSLQKLDQQMFYRYAGIQDTREYISYMNENAQTILNNGDLKDCPILILSSDVETSWDEVQIQLSLFSTNSKWVKLKNSSHYLHWSNQAQVMDEISLFIHQFD